MTFLPKGARPQCRSNCLTWPQNLGIDPGQATVMRAQGFAAPSLAATVAMTALETCQLAVTGRKNHTQTYTQTWNWNSAKLCVAGCNYTNQICTGFTGCGSASLRPNSIHDCVCPLQLSKFSCNAVRAKIHECETKTIKGRIPAGNEVWDTLSNTRDHYPGLSPHCASPRPQEPPLPLPAGRRSAPIPSSPAPPAAGSSSSALRWGDTFVRLLAQAKARSHPPPSRPFVACLGKAMVRPPRLRGPARLLGFAPDPPCRARGERRRRGFAPQRPCRPPWRRRAPQPPGAAFVRPRCS